jgi:Putative sensor
MEPIAAPADQSPDGVPFPDGMPYPLAEIDRVLAAATGREPPGIPPQGTGISPCGATTPDPQAATLGAGLEATPKKKADMSEAHTPDVAAPATGGSGRPPLARFFGVVTRSQSWRNLLYIALEFPLGLFYFVFLTTCLAVGFALLIVWVGIFVLGLTAACWWAFAAFERALADSLLGTDLRPSPQPWRRAEGAWARIKAHFGSSATWKDLAFLFIKFPLGLFSFVVSIILAATSLALITAPIYYRYSQSTDTHGVLHHGLNFGAWYVDRLWQALLLVPLGLLLAVVSFHVFNGLAALSRTVARGLLPRDTGPRPAPSAWLAPAASAWPVPPDPAWPTPPEPPQPTAPIVPVAPSAAPAPGAGAPPAGAPVASQPYGWVYYPPPPSAAQAYPPPTYPPPAYPPPASTPPPAAPPATPDAPWTQWPPLFGAPQTTPKSPSAPPSPAPPETTADEQSPVPEEDQP